MKVRASIKKRTPDSKIVRRKGRLYVINKKNPEVQAASGINFVTLRTPSPLPGSEAATDASHWILPGILRHQRLGLQHHLLHPHRSLHLFYTAITVRPAQMAGHEAQQRLHPRCEAR